MPCDRVNTLLQSYVDRLTDKHARKGPETQFESVIEPRAGKGPRFRLSAMGERDFLRMNSNSYLGLSFQRELILAEEYTDSPQVDLLIGTLGKVFGVSGGYVTSSAGIIDFLREVSPFYIYSNPITPGEAAACQRHSANACNFSFLTA